MLAANFSTVRENFKSYCDKVTDKGETLIVTRKDEKNVVLLSLEEYNAMLKAVKNAKYLAKLDRAITQMERGECKPHDLIEVDDE